MRFFSVAFSLCQFSAVSFASKSDRALIFGKTIRSAHADIIPIAGSALVEALNRSNKSSDFISDSAQLDQVFLNNYDVILLFDVSEKVLSEKAKRQIEDFVDAGGGLVALHASVGAGRDWKWLQNMLGVQFVDHPPIQDGQVKVLASGNALEPLKVQTWSQTDEWYNFSGRIESPNTIAMTVETTDKMIHPIAWSRRAGRGRFFYIAAGHSATLYADPQSPFMQALILATKWAASSSAQ